MSPCDWGDYRRAQNRLFGDMPFGSLWLHLFVSGRRVMILLVYYDFFEIRKLINPPMVKPFWLTYLAKGGGGWLKS